MTARLAQSAGKPAFVMFNDGPPNGPHIYSQAAELVEQIGLTVAPVRLSDRSAFRAATNTGQAAQEIEPKGKAAAEVAGLWQWLAKSLEVKAGKRAYVKGGRMSKRPGLEAGLREEMKLDSAPPVIAPSLLQATAG